MISTQTAHASAHSTHYDKEQVKQAARGRWPEILQRIAGFAPPGREGSPCPKCGGTDRLNRHIDFDEKGGILCRSCFSTGNHDGFAAIVWATGMAFSEAVDAVGAMLGVQPKGNGLASATAKTKKRDTIKDVQIEEWPEQLASFWCSLYKPITEPALRHIGAKSIRFAGKSHLGIPGRDQFGTVTAWTLFNWGGETFTVGRGEARKQVKNKLCDGSKGQSIIGSFDGKIVFKVEGPKDLAAFYSMENRPQNWSAISNSNGASEKPIGWAIAALEGKKVVVVGDCDDEGQSHNERWSKALAAAGVEHRVIQLPFPAGSKRDLRDFLCLYSVEDLREIIKQSQEIEIAPPELRVRPEQEISESVDDPFRLARANLDYYETEHRGKLAYWMGGWYSWKGTKYEPKGEEEIKTHLLTFIEREFKREYFEAVSQRKEIEHKRKVSATIVSNTYAALKSLCIISDKILLPSWIDGRPGKDVVAVTNGLVDLDQISRMVWERDGLKEYMASLYPHDPAWFSTVCLKYAYEPIATCPKWEAFLTRALDGNEGKIKLLQEWAGYLLLPDTSHHKFLCIQGSGANGKSVFLAAMTAMLGEENVSNVPIERFGDRFSLYRTLGKLANIVDEVPANTDMPEAQLKAFAAGNRMSFEDKGKPLFESNPTARVMFSCNEKPRFKDPSGAIWRRMLFVKFGRPIAESEKVLGMDTVEWWVRSGELPGILMWAIRGLHRLRNAGRFSMSDQMESEIEDYRRAGNPIREFLLENFQPGKVDDYEKVYDVYAGYRKWCADNGFFPASVHKFSQSLFEVFPNAKKERVRINGERAYVYLGIIDTRSDFV